MPHDAAPRLAWAVDTMSPAPNHRILEVGCGHGVAVTLISRKLTDGKVIGIDRSEKMVAEATRRNRAFIDADTAFLLRSDFPDSGLAPVFDTVFASHVNVFHKEPEAALTEVKRLLRPGGHLYLFWQAPPWSPGFDKRGFAEPIADSMSEHGFADAKVVYGQPGEQGNSFAVVAAAP